MVSILDIAEIEEGEVTVRIKGKDLSIRGLSSREIKTMLRRFPAIDKALSGEKGITGESIIESVPEAMGELAIMGTFHENDDARNKAKEAFHNFKVHEQLAVLNAILEQTFGEHWNPLVQRVKGFVQGHLGEPNPVQSGPGTAPPMELLRQLRQQLRSKTTMEDLFGTSVPGNSPDMPS